MMACTPVEHRQLLNTLYREQRSPMRAANGATWWAARDSAGRVIAGLSLTPMQTGAWMTGLLVAQTHRGQQVARQLVAAAASSVPGPLWLFCHPDLQTFYEKLGWTADPALPLALRERLVRYQQSKFLLPMGLDHSPQARKL